MDYRELARQINERLRVSHILSRSKSSTKDKTKDDEEFLRLWKELHNIEEMSAEQYKEFKNLCPFLESFCMIASGIEWDRKHNVKRW